MTPTGEWAIKLFKLLGLREPETTAGAVKQLSGRPLTAQQQALQRIENPSAELLLRENMKLYDEIEAARAMRQRAMRPPQDFTMDPEAIASTEDRFAGSPLLRAAPPIEGLSDPSKAIDEALTSDIDVSGFAAGGGRKPRYRYISNRAGLERERDALHAELADHYMEKSQYRMEMGPEDVADWEERRKALSDRLDQVTLQLRGARPRPNDPYDPNADVDYFDLPEDLDVSGFELTDYGKAPSGRGRSYWIFEYAKVKGQLQDPNLSQATRTHLQQQLRLIERQLGDNRLKEGPELGFASGKGRYSKDDAQRAADRNLGKFSRTHPEIDRQLDQVTSKLIQLEDQKANLPPEQYQKIREELTAEANRLQQQRLMANEAERTAQVDEKLKDAEYDWDIEDYPGYTPGRADIVSDLERQLRAILDESVVLANAPPSPAIDAKYELLKRRSRLLEEQLRKARQMPMGAGKSSFGEIARDAVETASLPQLGRAPTPNKKWAEDYLRAMRFLPLERQPEERPVPDEMPQLMKQAMGLAGKALHYSDPLSVGEDLLYETAKLPQPTIAAEMGPQRQRGYQRLSTTDEVRAKLEQHRRASEQLRP